MSLDERRSEKAEEILEGEGHIFKFTFNGLILSIFMRHWSLCNKFKI